MTWIQILTYLNLAILLADGGKYKSVTSLHNALSFYSDFMFYIFLSHLNFRFIVNISKRIYLTE